ncbi:hypothetical protein RJ640_019907 [Escallonia rubra]|uniref:RING-type domain-containing protein n=1 Tax=Escallonia rubra TaxID=112253 RepID=A0AA88RQT8_9ASTE|nr:hypothetical protein RJ640_019907 [Escallonia rubra]
MCDSMEDPATGDKSLMSLVSCSICLDAVTDNGDRSTAKLQCGHEFHLDCIGSAFNMKGAMQCPNCRKVERGQWLFANGSPRTPPELGLDDFISNENPYELNFAEMPFGVHWCPYGGLPGLNSSFEELESQPTPYHELQGSHAIIGEHTAAPSVSHSYVAYFQPATVSSESTDEPNFGHRWNAQSGHNEIFAHAFPAISVDTSGRLSRPFSTNRNLINGADLASLPHATLRSTRVESEAVARSGSFVPPFYGHGSTPRGGGSFSSPNVRPGSNARSQGRIQASHVSHHQQQRTNPAGMPSSIVSGLRRFSGPSGMHRMVPNVSQPDRSGGFHMLPPSGSSERILRGVDNTLPNRVQAWEGDHPSHFPVISFDRDTIWGSFQHTNTGGSDSGNRSGDVWQSYWS